MMYRVYFLITLLTSFVAAQDAIWAKWGHWTPCDKPCDYGYKRRYRGCVPSSKMICSDTDVELCTTGILCSHMSSQGVTPPDNEFEPEWLQWENWSSCSVTCGGGMRKRIKRCRAESDTTCMYTAAESCNEHSCNNEGRFDPGTLTWEPWSTCTVTCGGGLRRRARYCHDGICMESEEEICNEESCRFSNSGFTNSDHGTLPWEPWSTCTVSCGGGFRRRARDCHDGICMESEEELCNEESCRFSNSKFTNSDRGILSWEPWSTCTVSCGGGFRRRARDCHDGICMESEEELCNEESCRFSNSEFTNSDLGILSWEPWSTCTVSCGGGLRIRGRDCHDGICMESEEESCNEESCRFSNSGFPNSDHGTLSWEPWSTCTVSCGGGLRIRRRDCHDGICMESEEELCNEESCRFSNSGFTNSDLDILSWEPWSTCTVSCGGGTRKRVKRCPDGSCMESEGQSCNQITCEPRNAENSRAKWSSWNNWLSCSTQCGSGKQIRNRYCMGFENCIGEAREERTCFERAGCTPVTTPKPIYSNWSAWSKCSKTCGKGLEVRSRICMERQIQCNKETSQTRQCTRRICPTPVWSNWGSWSTCSTFCGEGRQSRKRTCISGLCSGQPIQNSSCKIRNCVESKWSKWSHWSQCSKTCDRGTIERTRSCIEGDRGLLCEGKFIETEFCLIMNCPVKEPEWSKWSIWSKCSKTCGRGIIERSRSCSKGDHGSTCKGKNNEIESCLIMNCPVKEPEWNKWGDWSKCSKTCDGGTRERSRSCNKVTTATSCKGKSKEIEQCLLNKCPVKAAVWSEWETWNECSVTCGNGKRERVRYCKNGSVRSSCKGESNEIETCKLKNCVAEHLSTWNSWTSCYPANPCGLPGWKVRTRTCIGGKMGVGNCKGMQKDYKQCVNPCNQDKWSEWGSWAPCSPRCGLGTKTRNRTCTGSDCIGSSTETQKCIGINCEMPAGRNVETKSTKCQEVQNINNGDITIVKEQEGIKLSFKCDGGFNLEGSSEITCDSNGQWSNRPPFCIANTCFKNMERIEKGRTCRKSCKDAKECLGISNDCICDDVCGKSCFNPENVICNPPEKPENGNVQFDSRGYWDYCRYSCLPGFVLSGSTQRRCRSDGKWSGSTPKCMRFETCGQAGNVGSIFNEGIVGARVLAGTASMTGAWPWQAMITVNAENDVRKSLQSLKGGGSIINDQWILTAAHIFDPMLLKSKPNAKGHLIILGMTAIDISFTLPDHARIFEPELLMIHPRYRHSMKNFDNDVSLIKLGKQFKVVQQKFMYSTALPFGKITFSNHIRAVCLPCSQQRPTSLVQGVRKSFKNDLCGQVDSYEESDKVVVTGFGRLGERSQRPRILQQGLLKVAGNSICRKAVKNINKQWQEAVFTSRMLCAVSGRKVASVDACTGDSGGPLVKKVTIRNGTDFWVQEGIVSWGFGCGRVDDEGRLYPGFYTKIKSVLPFIQSTMEANETGN
ncbi:A disintegrin and metalloproteinase with thrombospondin motifs gon-1-like isoform X2 [Styela clava]